MRYPIVQPLAVLFLGASTSLAAEAKAQWASPAPFRVAVTVKAGDALAGRPPVAADVDFAALLGDGRRVNRDSIRVVAHDAAGKPIDVPHKLGIDFNWNDAGKIWWRI